MLLWCHKRLRFMVHFTRACKTLLSENNKTRLTFEKQQEKNKNIICRPWSVRIEKNCALGLEHGPRPAASGRTQDLWHSFSQYGPPGRQIIYIYSNTESAKKMSVEISQRMFSEIMPAFTEMAEMFIMKTKNSEKRALFSIKCSRGALSIVDKIENWKNTKKKITSVDEKEKDEVKLHAALVLNVTFWAIYEPRRDT